MIVESHMASQDLECHAEISSVHLDQLLSKLVPLEHVEYSWRALFVGLNPVSFGLTPHCCMLGRINSKIYIICLTESWLGPLDNIEDFEIDGYHTRTLYQNRIENIHSGGVVTYIHKDISKHKHIKHLAFVHSLNHCLGTEITLNNKTTILLNVYRSPNQLNDTFLDKFNSMVSKVKFYTRR